ncbi:putative Helicase ATP-binding domain-containing protein [Azospirillaceae bacterium]
MADINKIKEYFPYPSAREGQMDLIEKTINAFENGKRFVIIEAPVGAGKSAIGYTVGNYFQTYYYVTAQKLLQSQLSKDFGEEGKWINENRASMVELKGRNAYPCNYYERKLEVEEKTLGLAEKQHLQDMVKLKIDCARGECKKKGKSKFKFCEDNEKGIHHCPYFIQRDKAISSDAVLMNFHSYIFQTEVAPTNWAYKDLLIIDECHLTESVLMDYVSLSFVDTPFKLEFPKLETAEEYYIYFEENDIPDLIIDKLRAAVTSRNDEDEEYWKSIADKYAKFKRSVVDGEDWVVKYESRPGYRTIELKPLFVNKFSNRVLFNKAEKILMMSGTVLSAKIMANCLGIEESEYEFISVDSQFPVENRLIHYEPSGSMSYKNKKETIPKMLADIVRICEQHDDNRGIVHSQSFELTEYVMNNSPPELKRRFFFQKNYQNKEEMLAAHAASKNGVIIAPAMHEGLDLKGDLSRFQIILKVPYPSYVDNPQLEMRMKISSDYYNYLTAMKLVQAYGRSIRSETDYAKTYILDEDFKTFFARSKAILPKWFKQAIVWTR